MPGAGPRRALARSAAVPLTQRRLSPHLRFVSCVSSQVIRKVEILSYGCAIIPAIRSHTGLLMTRPSRSVARRRFLKKAAAGAAAIVGAPALAQGQQGQEPPASPRADVYTTDKPGSDFMADVLKSLNFEYVAANPGSSFRGLHESFITYGNNKNPE